MTNRLENEAVIAALIEALRKHGSWCGETHVQKAAFFLSHLDEQSVPFEFILYKHGPFSFDLRDELTAMRANSFLKLEATFPYGSRFGVTEFAKVLGNISEPAVHKQRDAIDFVARKLSNYGVAALERVTTALYITVKCGSGDRVAHIRAAKPHISTDLASAAVNEVDNILSEWSANETTKTELTNRPTSQATQSSCRPR